MVELVGEDVSGIVRISVVEVAAAAASSLCASQRQQYAPFPVSRAG